MKQESFIKKVAVGVCVGLVTLAIVTGFTALGAKINDWKDKLDDETSKIESVNETLSEEPESDEETSRTEVSEDEYPESLESEVESYGG